VDIGLFIATYKQKVPVSHSAECWIVNLQSFVGTKLVCIVTETSGFIDPLAAIATRRNFNR